MPRAFFARPATDVAPELLGRVLVRVHEDGTRLVGRIVEVEAYEPGDPASHSYPGRPTPRTEVMFGPPGRLYVYFTYGQHFCSNVVTRRDGEGSAVLLRAVEPLEGAAAMARRRGLEAAHLLCSGPARLTQAFGIGRAENGTDLVRDRALYLLAGERLPARAIARSARIGVTIGGERRWRWFERDSRFVTPGRVGRGTGRLGDGPG
ncbi:MAG TPA: DNA-3-methyladenine glycosylase [Actinomycetota bacterium]